MLKTINKMNVQLLNNFLKSGKIILIHFEGSGMYEKNDMFAFTFTYYNFLNDRD